MNKVRMLLEKALLILETETPKSRESDLARMKLQECLMWIEEIDLYLDTDME